MLKRVNYFQIKTVATTYKCHILDSDLINKCIDFAMSLCVFLCLKIHFKVEIFLRFLTSISFSCRNLVGTCVEEWDQMYTILSTFLIY